MTIEEIPPIHAKIPAVTNLHKTVPANPPGWVIANLTITSGAINVAYMISATARFTSRKLMGFLWNITKRNTMAEAVGALLSYACALMCRKQASA